MEELKKNEQIKENFEDQNNILLNEDIEKQSYSKFMYNKLIKTRKKGLQYGIDIPKLKYALNKPEKSRKIFKIIGYSMLAITILMIIGFIVAYIISGVFPVFLELINGGISAYSKEALSKSLGISGIISFAATWLYVLIIILFLIPIILTWLLIKFTIKTLSFANLSKQEMAEGYEIKRYLLTLYIVMGTTLALIIFLALEGLLKGGLGIFIVVLNLAIFTICLISSIFISKERKKERVWFCNLSKEKQEDFLNQNNSIKKIKNLSSSTSSMFGG